MSNNFEAIMNKVAAVGVSVLSENMTFAMKVAHDFDGVAAKIGQQFEVPLPVAIAAEDVVPAATPPALSDTTQPTTFIKIDKHKMARFHLTNKELHEIDAGRTFVPLQMGEAIRTVTGEVNKDLASAYVDIYGYAGTAGTNPFNANINPVADLAEVLDNQLCPNGARNLAISNAAKAAALKLGSFNEAIKRGDANALKKGELGDLFGFMIGNEHHIPTHTTGAAAGYQINNGGGYAAGVKSLVIDTGTGAWVEGDIVTFAGHSQTYAVDAGSTTTLLKLKNALVAAVADDAAITKKASHVVNIGFDPGAFAFAARPLADDIWEGAPTIEKSVIISDPKTKLPLCLSYIPGWKSRQWAVSLGWGKKIVDPRRAARLAG